MQATKEPPAIPIDLPETLPELLERCCADANTHYHREKIGTPVYDPEEGVVYASDGHIAVRAPYTELLSDLDMREYDGTMSVIDSGLSVDGGGSEWKIDGIRSVLENAPKAPVFNEEECEDCNGYGSIETKCLHCGQWYEEGCDSCGGEGTVGGSEFVGWEWDEEHSVRWGELVFKPDKLALPILGAAAVQGAEIGTFYLEEAAKDNSALAGQVGEIGVLIMPMIPSDYTEKHSIPESSRA